MEQELNIEEMREAEAANEKRTSRLLGRLLALLDRELNVLLSCAALAKKTHSLDKDAGFMYAFVGLSSKIVSNAESAVKLLKTGRYGDAVVLLRVAISAVNTIQFLAAYDKHVDDWMVYKSPKTTPEENKRIYQVFLDKTIRKKLEAKGIDSMAGPYQDLSQSVHSSLWGLQAYAMESYDQPMTHYFEFAPSYNAVRGTEVGTTLLALLSFPVDTFYNRYLDTVGETEEWRELVDQWIPLRTECLNAGKKLKTKVLEILNQPRPTESG